MLRTLKRGENEKQGAKLNKGKGKSIKKVTKE
jgi:hypothetical protein